MSAVSSLKVGEIVSPLTIETLVNGGAGLARHEGRVVFVPHTAVGDVVSCRITKVKKKFLTAEIAELLQPAVDRCQPKCPVSGDCGGCQWLHLPYVQQLSWKERLFNESLSRSVGISSEKILPIVPASNEWNYRSRVQIKCCNTKAGFVTGFYRPQSHHVVAIKQCPIIAPELNLLLAQLRSIITNTSHANEIPQIDLGIDSNNKCLAVIHYDCSNFDALVELLRLENLDADLLIKSTHRKSLHGIKGSGDLQISVDNPEIYLSYAAGGFAQVNLAQNRALVESVIGLSALTGEESVLDLYCGMGNFSLPLARRAKQVIGVEESPISIEMAKKNGRHNNINNVEFCVLSAVGALTTIAKDKTIDILILDPPRIGAVEVMAELVEIPIARVVYVSCDPQTLARDLKVLVAGGYELISSQPFDMFPHAHHCESVTLLEYKV